MLRFIVPAIAAAGLLIALPAHAADASAGVYDDTTYPAAPATFTSARDAGPIVTPELVYDGVRTAFVNGLLPRDETALRLASHDDVSYPTASPVVAATAVAVAAQIAQQPGSTQRACDCLAHR